MTPPTAAAGAPTLHTGFTKDRAKPGVDLFDSAKDLEDAITDGKWLDGIAAGLGMAEGFAAAFEDPIAVAAGLGVGIILDYVHPISDWFDQFAGSEDAVKEAAKSWNTYAVNLGEAGHTIAQSASTHLDGMQSVFADAAREHLAKASEALTSSGMVCLGVCVGLEQAAELVKKVREYIRQVLADIVAEFAEKLLVAAATAGAALAPVLAALIVRVAQWTAKIANVLKAVIGSLKALAELFAKVWDLLEAATELMESLAKGSETNIVEKSSKAKDVGNAVKDVKDKAGDVKDAFAGDEGSKKETSEKPNVNKSREQLADRLGG